MKCKTKLSPSKAEPGKVLQIRKGETTITLRDADGHEEVYHDTNMQTNAINEHLRNCGWLNRDNLDQTNLATQLLGGVLLYHDSITEDANIVVAPAGNAMTANACHGVGNGESEGDPTEMGSYVAGESGWQNDGSLLLVFEWTTSQGNGVISAVCATNKEYGYCGEGNANGLQRSSKQSLTLSGTATPYTIQGYPCKLSLTDSSVYGITLDQANETITIRQYRLPLTKVNIKGTPAAPVVLSETEIAMPAHMVGATIGSYESTGGVQDVDGHLIVLNTATVSSGYWGTDYTQYMWDIDPTAGTVTESTLLNTSGVATLHCIENPMWMGRDCVAFVDGYEGSRYDYYRDTRKIYSMKRTEGVWGAIQACDNPYGQEHTSNYGNVRGIGWDYGNAITVGKGIVVTGKTGGGNNLLFDYETNTALVTNGNWTTGYLHTLMPTDAPLIGYTYSGTTDGNAITIVRKQTCISTINNLGTPVTKTADKTMKLQYRFEFEEDE